MYAVVQGGLTVYVLHAGIVYSQILLMNREDKFCWNPIESKQNK